MSNWLGLLVWNLIAFTVIGTVVWLLRFVVFFRRRAALMDSLWLLNVDWRDLV